MPESPDDWRHPGEAPHLRGLRLTLKHYQALSAQWEHEHCEFCWHTFLDPNYSEANQQTLRDKRDGHSGEGYTNAYDETYLDHTSPRGSWWFCHQCFADFAAEFGWVVVETDPDAWPYERPEPDPRPTAADDTPAKHGWVPRPE